MTKLNWFKFIKRACVIAIRKNDFFKALITIVLMCFFTHLLSLVYNDNWYFDLIPLFVIALFIIKDIILALKDANRYGLNEEGGISYPINVTDRLMFSAYAKLSLRNSTLEILASRNVSSVTDNGVGDFTINFMRELHSENMTCEIVADQSVNYKIMEASPKNIRVKLDTEPKSFSVNISE